VHQTVSVQHLVVQYWLVTEGWTHDDSICCASKAARGKSMVMQYFLATRLFTLPVYMGRVDGPSPGPVNMGIILDTSVDGFSTRVMGCVNRRLWTLPDDMGVQIENRVDSPSTWSVNMVCVYRPLGLKNCARKLLMLWEISRQCLAICKFPRKPACIAPENRQCLSCHRNAVGLFVQFYQVNLSADIFCGSDL